MPEPRTNLPRGMPKGLVDFIRCRRNEVDIEAGDLDWLPKPESPMIPADVTPGLTFEPGSEPGTIDISVGFGMISISVTASIVDGKLQVDPPPFPGLDGPIDDWVDDLNADLEANGMQLEGVSIRDGKLHLSKQPIAAPPTQTAVVTPPTVAVTTPAVSPPVSVIGLDAPPRVRAFHDRWVKAGVAGGVLALGVAAFILFGGDGDDPTIPFSPPVFQDEDPAALDVETPAEAQGDDDQSDDSSNDVGPETVEPETVDPEPDPVEPESDPFGSLLDGLDDFAEDQGFVGVPVFFQPDAVDDYNFCGANQASGADITGLVAFQDSDMVALGARMARSPLASAEDFSYAVSFQVAFASGEYRDFLWQVHDGVPTIGEQMPDGTMNPDSDVEATINETGVVFLFEADPSDPVAFGMAQGFNLGQDGDSIGCDLAYGAASPSLLPPEGRLGDCTAGDGALCLNGDRFQVNVDWSDGSTSGSGVGTSVDSDSGLFYFVDETNVDLVVRVINACNFDENYWVFAASSSDVEYTLTVTDTEAGNSRSYESPLGQVAPVVTDTTAFATCP